MHDEQRRSGVTLGLAAYAMWGSLPLYWGLLSAVPSIDILCYRFMWAAAFMAALLLPARKWRETFLLEAGRVLRNGRELRSVLCAAALIAANWFTYIFAVGHGFVTEASLGYFINPLLNFVLAIAFLKERLTKATAAACCLSFAGVAIITAQAGGVPWISLALALTFALYGLIKKGTRLQSYTSLTLETAALLPFVAVYLAFFSQTGFMPPGVRDSLLSALAGIVTAVPLLLFAESAKRISYIALGFIQYLSPTITLLLAVFAFREPCPPAKLAGFAVIWAGIAVFSLDSVGKLRNGRQR
jgi:chloramphenicol-sensitive protein RarD